MSIGLIMMCMAMLNAGCALIGTAISAGAAYGIYMATKK
jgi:hypothetical protein